eukprot:GGOE01003073.1.p1 GENE.GGOE01003073.1~~GGOE01003073.1.p1  ORF type:complete len:642 (-),score=53.73 GGOE01003073.1:168-2093(-)
MNSEILQLSNDSASGLPSNASCKLFVSNCPKDISDDDIYSLFNEWVSEIASITWATSDEDSSFLGYGWVDFTNIHASAAAQQLNGLKLRGHEILISFSQPKRAMDEDPPCPHKEWSDWKRLRQKNGLQHFVCVQCGAKWKRATQARKETEKLKSEPPRHPTKQYLPPVHLQQPQSQYLPMQHQVKPLQEGKEMFMPLSVQDVNLGNSLAQHYLIPGTIPSQPGYPVQQQGLRPLIPQTVLYQVQPQFQPAPVAVPVLAQSPTEPFMRILGSQQVQQFSPQPQPMQTYASHLVQTSHQHTPQALQPGLDMYQKHLHGQPHQQGTQPIIHVVPQGVPHQLQAQLQHNLKPEPSQPHPHSLPQVHLQSNSLSQVLQQPLQSQPPPQQASWGQHKSVTSKQFTAPSVSISAIRKLEGKDELNSPVRAAFRRSAANDIPVPSSGQPTPTSAPTRPEAFPESASLHQADFFNSEGSLLLSSNLSNFDLGNFAASRAPTNRQLGASPMQPLTGQTKPKRGHFPNARVREASDDMPSFNQSGKTTPGQNLLHDPAAQFEIERIRNQFEELLRKITKGFADVQIDPSSHVIHKLSVQKEHFEWFNKLTEDANLMIRSLATVYMAILPADSALYSDMQALKFQVKGDKWFA